MKNLKQGLQGGQRVQGLSVILALFVIFVLFPEVTHAQSYYPEILYRYEHHLFSLDPNAFPAWRKAEEVWTHDGQEILPPQHLRVDGDELPPLPEGIARSVRPAWNTEAIAATIEERIATVLNRPRGEVTIRKNGDDIEFEGVGFLGRTVLSQRAALLTKDALEKGVYDVHLPMAVEQPVMNVLSTELQDMGIREVVTVGESDFVGSPNARQHNIQTGLSKFNGHIVPQGSVFSFNEVLGPVDGSTGYQRELVILGDRTVPEYGGGLCQISTTAYRGVWEHGFPIPDRRNHSFAVQYYAPQGTDATIYPPHTDMKFTNDGPSALLLQTHVEDMKAYYIYYGTGDERSTEIVGPFVWNRRGPPPDKVEYTTDLPPGATRSIGKAVSGMSAAWFRILLHEDGSETIEPYYSIYEARPNFTQVGVSSVPEPVHTPVPEGPTSEELLENREERLKERTQPSYRVSPRRT